VVSLHTNHFRFRPKGGDEIRIYKVDFGPELKGEHERRLAIRELNGNITQSSKKDIKKVILFGTLAFTSYDFGTDHTEIVKINKQEFPISLTYHSVVSFDQPQEISPIVMQFLRQVTKEAMRQRGFLQVGKVPRFFNTQQLVPVAQEKLKAWPGFLLDLNLLQDVNYTVNVDTCTKFVRSESVNDMINEQWESGLDEDEIAKPFNSSIDQPRITVITLFNSR